jgi:predicted SprT family Zn-dependent metalloprotease
MPTINPTELAYDKLNEAYSHFNRALFADALPACLITMQRKNKTYGYFAGDRFGSADGQEKADEIALNPSHFRDRTTEAILATLVHEMAHLWQHHHGKASRPGYHNAQWAERMRAIGLIPSDTEQPGGKETGQKMGHYVAENGAFAKAVASLIAGGFALPYVELWGDAEASKRKQKASSKTKYTCPACGVNAWAKPDTRLICGDCELPLEADEEAEPPPVGDADEGDE